MKIKLYNLTRIIFVREKGEQEEKKNQCCILVHHAQLPRTGMFPEELAGSYESSYLSLPSLLARPLK